MNDSYGSDVELSLESDDFDAEWYLNQYPDVKMLSMDPWEHYRWIGKKLGRRGSPVAGSVSVRSSEQISANISGESRNPLSFFMAPADGLSCEGDGAMTRLMHYVWKSRPDLQQNFDLDLQEGRTLYSGWFQETFEREYGISLHSLDVRDTSNLARNGVNLIGYAKGELGMGEHVRMVANSLNTIEFPFDVVNVKAGGHGEGDSSADLWITQNQNYTTNIFHINADAFPLECLRYGRGFYNIGYWAWELPDAPPEFFTAMNMTDEIWGCSEFTAAAFRSRTDIPVITMPLAVEVPDLSPKKYNKIRYGLPHDKFTFLFTFDAASYLDRKNPIDIVRAFNLAFPKGDEPVHLVFKVQNTAHITHSGLPRILWDELLAAIGDAPRITIINERFDRDEVFGLSLACDAFVSLHRSEGFGRNLTEAMSYGKPIISTNFSGSCEFINEITACPIDYRLIDVPDGAYPYSAGQCWAQPDVEQAAWAMRKLYEDDAFREEKGRAGRQFVRSKFNPRVVGERYRQRLEKINETRSHLVCNTNSVASKNKNITKRKENTALFTIVSKNYISYARTVLNSVKKIHPEYEVYLCLADDFGVELDKNKENYNIILSNELNIPDFIDMSIRYDIMEFNTAVKPFMFRYLLENEGFDKVIYFDPDLYLYNRLDELNELLDNGASVVLTPHILKPLPDDRCSPDDHAMLKAGVFNLGFMAARSSDETRNFIEWWGERLRTGCYADFDSHMFTDQKWCDLAPCFLPNLKILNSPAYNVAYWNLANRHVERSEDGVCRVNGHPLIFFHFSGVNPTKLDQVSKHQTRFKWDDLNPACQELFEGYAVALLDNDWQAALEYPYAYNEVAKWKIPPMVRRLYRTMNPGPRSFHSYDAARDYIISSCNQLSSRYDDPVNPVSELMLEIYRVRPDLQKAFDLNESSGRKKFRDWFASSAPREYGLSSELLPQYA